MSDDYLIATVIGPCGKGLHDKILQITRDLIVVGFVILTEWGQFRYSFIDSVIRK